MASTRPPGTYSASARTGKRHGGSAGGAGMVRRAGSDALAMSLRSTVGSSAPASAAAGAARTQRSGLGVALVLRNPPQHNPARPACAADQQQHAGHRLSRWRGQVPAGPPRHRGGSAAEGGFHVGGGRGGVGRHRQRAGVHRQRRPRPLRRDDGGIDAQHRVSGDGARPEAGREHAGRR